MFSVCVVVPVYNHALAITETLAGLRSQALTVLLVDDGSEPACAAVLRGLVDTDPDVRLLRLPQNRGKGAAVMAGLACAAEAGFSHVLQIDADGQHDSTDIPQFIAAACTEPSTLICGAPVFDASIPRHRLYLRYLTHAMVWINTLSFDILDSMCGLRVYPLTEVLAVIEREHLGNRMDFDIEVLVRLHWRGVAMRWLPTRVGYPRDGVSHFRLVRDNWLITLMHTRLFFGMLRRAPMLIARRLRVAFGAAAGVAT